MQRHFRTSYCQVSHLCRQLTNSYLINTPSQRGVCSSTPVSSKLLKVKSNDIIKSSSSLSSPAGGAFKAQNISPAQDQEFHETAKMNKKSGIDDPILSVLGTQKSNVLSQKQSEFETTPIADDNETSSNLSTKYGTCKDLEALLNDSNSEDLTTRSACQLIMDIGEYCAQMKQKNPVDLTKIEKDERFIRLCNFIQRGNFLHNPYLLVLALRGLHNMGFLSKHSIVQDIENELKWLLRRCPIKVLPKIIHLVGSNNVENLVSSSSSQLKGTKDDVLDSESSLLSSAIQTMNRRWAEVRTGSDFISTFGISSYLANDTVEKLEDHATELIPQFTTMEMVKIVINLAQQKRRPTPLLRTIAFHLSRSNDNIPSKDLIELIFAFSKVSFTDYLLLQKLYHELAPEIHKIKNPSLISSLATTIGRTRCYHKELIQVLEEWINKNLNLMRPFDYAAWLLTSSVLNLKSEQQEQFYEKARLFLNQKNTSNPINWLNIVHSLLVLNQAPPELLVSVLQPQFVDFVDKLTQDFIGPRIKLLNINATLKSILESLSSDEKKMVEHLLGSNYMNKWIPLATAQDTSLSKLVLNTLEQFLPPSKYLLQGVKSNSGVFIDAVCFVNSKMEPVPIQTKDLQTERKDIQRIAFIVAGYNSLCLGSNLPTGQVSLNEQLVRGEGYNVVLVPYNEFSLKATLVQRVQYLENKIKESTSQQTVQLRGRER